MSSAFWLGWRTMLGLAAESKTTQNMLRTGECVLNLPSEDMVAAVDRLARTTGTERVPAGKVRRGYRYEKDKFGTAELTAIPSETVSAPRVLECPIQLEATVAAVRGLAEDDEHLAGRVQVIEVAVQRVHVEEDLLMDGEPNRIDPDRWRPLIMSFQQFYGLAPGRLRHSRLGEIPERLYAA
jgi:flavin reductase (DIM6/NTAB) family NADH-FMN oxidoreductase RutF